MEGELADR